MNERKVRAEEKKDKAERRSPEKELAKLKERYDKIAEKMSSGWRAPVEELEKLKIAAEGEGVVCNEGGKRLQLSQSFCYGVYEKLVNAMFESGDMNGLGELGETDLLVVAAFEHRDVKCAIAAAEILISREPQDADDLNLIVTSRYDEVKAIVGRAMLDVDNWPEVNSDQ